VGDLCPSCVRDGEINPGKVTTVEIMRAAKEKKANAVQLDRKNKEVRGQKGLEETKQEIESKLRQEFDEKLKKAIESMKVQPIKVNTEAPSRKSTNKRKPTGAVKAPVVSG